MQLTWMDIWNFVKSPITAYVGALVSFAVPFLVRWLNRFRPKRIICRELRVDNLLRVGQDVSRKIEIKFAGNLIGALWIYEFEVTNPTNENIDNIGLLVNFGQGCHILEKDFRVTPQSAEQFQVQLDHDGKSKCKVNIDCLNSSKHHGHKVIVKFHCDDEINRVTIQGMGKGWSVVHKRFKLPRSLGEFFFKSLTRLETLTIYVVVGWVVIAAIMVLVYSLYFGYRPSNLRSADAVPFVAMMLIWLAFLRLLRWVALRSPVWAKSEDLYQSSLMTWLYREMRTEELQRMAITRQILGDEKFTFTQKMSEEVKSGSKQNSDKPSGKRKAPPE